MPTLEEIIAGVAIAGYLKGGLWPCKSNALKDIQAGINLVKELGYNQSILASMPPPYEILSLSASEARNNKPYEVSGDYLEIEHHPATVPFFIRLNSADAPLLDLSKLNSITGSFYKLLVTNVAGNGSVVLKICRGLRLEAKDLVGLAELAARLGSIVSFDRRGEVLWMDDFEATVLHWDTFTDGLGASVALSNALAYHGGWSCLLTTGSTLGAYASIAKYLIYPIPGRIGVEVTFTIEGITEYFWLEASIDDSTTLTAYTVRIYPNTGVIEYRDSTGAMATLATVPFAILGSMFHTMKLVVDSKNSKYIRLILDDVEYDMCTIPAYTGAASGGVKSNYIQIWHQGALLNNAKSYIDNVIVTQNEP